MALAALHLAGVAVAGVAAAALTEALHEVASLSVDLGTLEQLAPSSSVNLAWTVIKFRDSAALYQGESTIYENAQYLSMYIMKEKWRLLLTWTIIVKSSTTSSHC